MFQVDVESGAKKTLAQMFLEKCDYLQTHKYEDCKDCYRFDTCKNSINKESEDKHAVN